MVKIITNLFKSSKISESLKTTVPQSIAVLLELSAEDSLEWTIFNTENGPAALVRRVKK